MKEEEVEEAIKTSKIYDKLRKAHSLVKDVLYDDNFEKLSDEKRNAIGAVNSVLYLAEKHFTDF